MSRWHTDRQEQATGGRAHVPSVSVGQLAAAGREGLASSLSRQSGAVWLLAFALAILAHVLMTVWLMMTVSPQTGTQQPAAVSMLFEAPRAPLPAASQAEADKTASQQQTQPLPTMKDMPDMDAASLGREMPEVLPPSVRPEADHLPQAPALPKKMVPQRPAMLHDMQHSKAEVQSNASPTAMGKTTGPARAKADVAPTGGQAAAPASTAAAGQKGSFQLSCSVPEAHYPVSARHLHEEGEAVAEVSINGKGQVIAARLVKSTGYDDLDDQALETVKNLHCTAPASTVVTGRIPVGFHIQ